MMQTRIKRRSNSLLLWRLRKFWHNKLAVFGISIVLFFMLLFILVPIFSPFDSSEPSFGAMNQSPSAAHWLGTDSLGRDIFTRVIYGGFTSCYIALASAMIGAIIGAFLGGLGGYFGGIWDVSLVRVSEVFQSVPQLILVMVIMAFVGQGTGNIILIFSITGWTGTFRQVRAAFYSAKEETYVEVCRAFGMKDLAIIFKQIMPSVLTTVIIAITIAIPNYVLSEAALSYLGIGVPTSVVTWGNMLNAAKSINVVINYWWVWISPGVAISLFVLAINFFGDGLRDVFDPRQQ